MYNTDKPIKLTSEDKLNRTFFAKKLAKSIMDLDSNENYTLSLQGSWGCGKTSVLNMTIEELNSINSDSDEDKKITIIPFNPWNFTSTNQLLNQFFITLGNVIKISDANNKLSNVGAALEKYSSALEYSEYIPVVGPYLKLIPKLSKVFGESIKENADAKLNDVSYRKGVVEEELKKIKSKLLVVIDDIDRLPNEQIKLIFQLVNSVAGFPNVVYLLSFDKEIVVRALGDLQQCNGEEYLEKIVQVPFDVPPISKSKMNEILFDLLHKISGNDKGIKLQDDRWNLVFSKCVSLFIDTLRDVKRYSNVLAFEYSTVRDEVNFIDMAAMSSLKLFAKPIYNWIRDNNYSLTGGYGGNGVSMNDISVREKEYMTLFSEVYPSKPKIMFDVICCLFPKFNNLVSFHSDFVKLDNIHQKMRIASPSKFNLYFSLSLEDVKISRYEFDKSIISLNENELRDYFKRIESDGLRYEYYQEINLNMARVPEERIELLLSVLLFDEGVINNEKGDLKGFNFSKISVYSLHDMLLKIGDANARFLLIDNMFKKTEFISFTNLLYLLHIIELSHGRIVKTDKAYDEKLITIEQLNSLEEVFIDRMNCFVNDYNIFKSAELKRICMLWHSIDNVIYDEYINENLVNDFDIMRFFAMHVSKWSSGGQVIEYELNDDAYTDYFSKAELSQIIKRSTDKRELWEFDEQMICALAAFDLAYNENINGLISVTDVQERIDLWQTVLVE